MRFDDPALLALLALVPLYGWALWRLARQPGPSYLLPRLSAINAAVNTAVDRVPAAGLILRTLPWLGALRLAAAALIVVAVARPQTTVVEAVRPAEGIDIVLAIDTSSSMTQFRLGGQETRIDAARRVARDFIAQREDDRIGLVIFQRSSLVLSPLTLDLAAIDTLIETSVRSGLIPDGTALGLAMAEAVDLLRGSQAASRVVVALTDGENNVPGVTTQQAAAVARALGVRIYTIGLPSGQRNTAAVSFNELPLIYAADETGGRYFRAADAAELAAAYEEIAQLERARVGEETLLRSRELAPWLLFAALCLILLEVGMRAGPWRRMP